VNFEWLMMGSQSETNTIGASDATMQRYALGLTIVHAAMALFAVLTFVQGFTDYKWPRWQTIFMEALALSQVGLLAAFLGSGTVRLSVRLISFAIVLVFWLIVFNYVGLDHEDWLAIFLIEIVGICYVLIFARLSGGKFVRKRPAAEAPPNRSKYRFSLRQMLLLMAAASFLLGLGTLLWRFQGFQPPSIDRGVLPRAKVLGLSLPPILLVALWATLGTTRKLLPFVVLVLVTVIASFKVADADQNFRTAWWSALPRDYYPIAYAILVWAYALISYLSLFVLWIGGFRFAKR
jgi:hypothetical protein